MTRSPDGQCTSCGIRRGVPPGGGTCEDCQRRGTVRGGVWYPGARPPELADAQTTLGLALAVIKAAQTDVATHVARHGQVWAHACYATDAREFLTTRLWEPDNLWGDIATPALHPGHRYELRKYVDGLKVRPASQGQRLKRPTPARVATAVVDADA